MINSKPAQIELMYLAFYGSDLAITAYLKRTPKTNPRRYHLETPHEKFKRDWSEPIMNVLTSLVTEVEFNSQRQCVRTYIYGVPQNAM